MSMVGQALKWANYQDQQLQVLKAIEKSFESSLRISTKLENNLTNVSTMLNSIGTMFTKGFITELDQYGRLITRVNIEHEGLARNLLSLNDAYDHHRDVIDDTTSAMEDAARRDRENQDDKDKKSKEWIEKLDSSVNLVSAIFKKAGEIADPISATTNFLIQATGEAYSQVENFRSDFYDQIDALNRDTGNYYDASKAFSDIARVARGSGITDVEILSEVSRPILLAQESMNLNLNELTQLFGNWYTRYNFSSLSMESVVDQIRMTTAGSKAAEEAVLRSIVESNRWIEYYSGGDAKKIAQMTEGITKVTAYIASQGADSAQLTSMVNEIASGKAYQNTGIAYLLNLAGTSVNKAQSAYSEGDTEYSYLALLKGIDLLEGELKKNDYATVQQYLDTVSLNESIIDTMNAFNNSTTSYEEFLRGVKDNPTTTEAIEGKYVNFQDKITNYLSQFADSLASIQESLGIGLGELAGISAFIVSIIAAFAKSGSIGAALGSIGSVLGLSSGTAAPVAIGVGVTAVSSVLGGLAVIAGVALAIDATTKDIQKINNAWYDSGFGNEELIASLDEQSRMVVKKSSEFKDGELVDSYSKIAVSNADYEKNKSLYDSWENDYLMSKLNTSDLSLGQQLMESITSGSNGGPNGMAIGDMRGTTTNPQGVYSQNYGDIVKEDADLMALFNSKIAGNPLYLEAFKAYTYADFLWSNAALKDFIDNIEYIAPNLLSGSRLVRVYDENGNVRWRPTDEFEAFTAQGYETGSNFIERDQLAYVHQGEAITPRKYNPAANTNELEYLRSKSSEDNKLVLEEYQKTREYTKNVVTTLKEIKEFLEDWQEDSMMQAEMTHIRSKFAGAVQNVASQY